MKELTRLQKTLHMLDLNQVCKPPYAVIKTQGKRQIEATFLSQITCFDPVSAFCCPPAPSLTSVHCIVPHWLVSNHVVRKSKHYWHNKNTTERPSSIVKQSTPPLPKRCQGAFAREQNCCRLQNSESVITVHLAHLCIPNQVHRIKLHCIRLHGRVPPMYGPKHPPNRIFDQAHWMPISLSLPPPLNLLIVAPCSSHSHWPIALLFEHYSQPTSAPTQPHFLAHPLVILHLTHLCVPDH